MKLCAFKFQIVLAIFFLCSLVARAETQYFFQHAYSNKPFTQVQSQIQSRIADAQNSDEKIELRMSLASLYLQFDRMDLLVPLLSDLAALEVDQQVDNNGLKWQILKGYSQYSFSQYAEAETHFNEARTLVDTLSASEKITPGFTYLIAILNVYSGINDAYLQRYSQATQSISNANQIANEHKWPVLGGLSLYYTGDVNYELKNYEQAQSFYQLAKTTYPQNAKNFAAFALLSEAQMINIVGDRQQAFRLLEESIEVFNELEDISALSYAYLLKSYFYSKDGNKEQALNWIRESVILREQLGNPVSIANSYVHYSANLAENDQSLLALEYAEKAALLVEPTEDLAGQWDAFNNYAGLLNEHGEYQKAFEYMSKSERALLAKARLDITSETARLNSEFHLAQQQIVNQFLDEKNALLETQLLQQQQLQKRQEWIVFGLILFALLVTLFMVIIFKLYRKNKRLAVIDNLTGLRNRRSILESGEQIFTISKRYKQDLCVLMLDVDNFKSVNDNYGHAEGDKVLKYVASICKDALRSSDYVGRVGGEEFLFILPNSKEVDGTLLAKRLFQTIRENEKLAELKVDNVTFSIGLAAEIERCSDFLELASFADAALYKAKNSGKNQLQKYTEEMQFNKSA